MEESLNILKEEKILQCLQGRFFGKNFYFFDCTDSTNTRAEEFLKSDSFDGRDFAVVASTQTAGRGRFNRKWDDSSGSSICISVAFNLENRNVKNLDKFGLLVGIEICKILRKKTATPIMLKWPNDLYFDSKKLGGMIAYASAKNGRMSSLIFGVGINFAKFGDVENRTDLTSISKSLIEINDVCAEVILSIFMAFERLENGEKIDLKSEFAPFDFLYGTNLSLTDFTNVFSGKALGVDENGSLILKSENENIYLCKSGETTILKDK